MEAEDETTTSAFPLSSGLSENCLWNKSIWLLIDALPLANAVTLSRFSIIICSVCSHEGWHSDAYILGVSTIKFGQNDHYKILTFLGESNCDYVFAIKI